MFRKNRKTRRNARSHKRQFSNHFAIESLEDREMMAADLMQSPLRSVQSPSPAQAAFSTSTPGGTLSTGPTTSNANFTLDNIDLDNLPVVEIDYVPPTLGASFANGVLTITGSDQADNIEVYKKDGMLYVREVVQDSILFSMSMPDPIVMQNARAFTANPLGPTLDRIVVNANGGNDWIKIDESLNVPVTMRGGAGDDTLMGGSGADTIYGEWGNDKILGYGGNDTLQGDIGNDLIIGGDGNDHIYGNDGDDNLVGGNGDDWMEGGNGNDQMFGEAGNDVMIGGPGQNLMDGGAGNDYLIGGDDIDAIYGGDGDDFIRGNGGDDRIRGEGGNDDIEGGLGADAIDGGDHNDYIDGKAGNDVIAGGYGNDTIYGGADQDWINGESGNDYLYGGDGNDYVVGEDGADTVNGGTGSNLVYTNDPPGTQLGQVTQALGWSDVTDFVGDVWDGIVGAFNWTVDKARSIGWRFYDWAANIDDRLIRLSQDLAGALSNWPWEADFWKGLGRTVVDALEVVGLGEAWEIAFEILKPWQRGMTSQEIDVARSVFGSSINWDKVRFDEHSLMAWIGRTHTIGYLINSTDNISDRTMIHELTHVWQYVTSGLVYIPEAIDAQNGAGYDFGGLASLTATKNAGGGMSAYNREQQGEIIATYFDKIQAARATEATGGYATLAQRQELDVYVYFVKQVSTLTLQQLDTKDPPIIAPPVATFPVKTTKRTFTSSSSLTSGAGSNNAALTLDAAYARFTPPARSGGFQTIAEENRLSSEDSFKPVTKDDVDLAFALMS
jgi:hypothetical protein